MLAHRRNFIIQVSTHCAGEIFIWNHSKNNNVSTSYPLCLSSFAASTPSSLFLSVSRKQRNTQRQIKLKVTQLFSVCAGPMIPPDMMALLSGAPSLVMPARVYHRAYKSVDEDQIGFQKYKIHGDIKKQKEGKAVRHGEQAARRSAPTWGERTMLKELVGGTREAAVIGGHDSARDTTCLREFLANLYAFREPRGDSGRKSRQPNPTETSSIGLPARCCRRSCREFSDYGRNDVTMT